MAAKSNIVDDFSQPFALPPEPGVVTLDFQDVQTGQGFLTYYAVLYKESGADNQAAVLSRNFLEGDEESGFGFQDPETSPYNIDSEVFLKPLRLQGTAWIDAYIEGVANDEYCTIRLQKVDGATAAVTNVSDTITSQNTQSGTTDKFTQPIPLTTTDFKIGDKLRLYVTFPTDTGIWIKSNADEPFKLLIPSKIDI